MEKRGSGSSLNTSADLTQGDGPDAVPAKPTAFTGTEVCKFTGATPHMLRYWSKLKLCVPSIQDTGGIPGKKRLYSSGDLAIIQFIVAKRKHQSLQSITAESKR